MLSDISYLLDKLHASGVRVASITLASKEDHDLLTAILARDAHLHKLAPSKYPQVLMVDDVIIDYRMGHR